MTRPTQEGPQGVREQARWVAAWVEDLAAGSYGPGGAAKVLDHGDAVTVTRSAAAALADAAVEDASVRPYKALARQMHIHAGDQGTAALLLAARLVKTALDGANDGLPVVVSLEGYALASRQALAVLSTLAARAPLDGPLEHVMPGRSGTVRVVTAGLLELGRAQEGALDLDDVDIRCEGDATLWADGVVAQPGSGPDGAATDVGVALVGGSWTEGLQSDARHHAIRDVRTADAMRTEETRRRRDWLERLEALGVGLVACRRSVDETTAGMAASRGIHVWSDCPKDAEVRLARATGARPVPRIQDAGPADLGLADLEPRPARRGGLWVRGPGPSATLVLPGTSATQESADRMEAERLLRAAGALLADPRAVPGGGRWQRETARALRSASDAAPGRTPLALRAAAGAFDALADDLVRNLGLDPLERALPAGAGEITDSWPAVHLAVASAFQLADAILRVDARHDKRPSAPEGLRGGTGPAGSPKGMPGDIPPLM